MRSKRREAQACPPVASAHLSQFRSGPGTARRAVRRSGLPRAPSGREQRGRLASGAAWLRLANGRGGNLAKILIVEDNALNIKLFCDLLAAHGHEPEAVTDSRVAIEAVRNFEPDLVITDIQLPHVSGLDLIRLIRGDEKLADIPIMAVTAYSARGDEERIRAAGAQAYVSKPISVVRFAETVEQLLKDGHEAAKPAP